VRTPFGLGQQGCKASKGGAKKSISEIWHNFQGFSFFEVKLKLIIIQCPYRRKWHFWGSNFQNFRNLVWQIEGK
jgi:hypothetical protein